GGRQGDVARGQHGEARAFIAERSERGGSWLSRRGVSVLGRIVLSCKNASTHRRQAPRRNPKGSGDACHSGKAGETRRPAATHERRRIPTGLPERYARNGKPGKRRKYRADELPPPPVPAESRFSALDTLRK